MPFTYHIETEGSLVRVMGTGQGNYDSAHNTFSDLLADPNLHRPFGLLVDVRLIHNLPSREEVNRIAMFAHIGHGKLDHVAALVVNRGVQFGVARMIQVLAELQGVQIKVFTDDLLAQLWLQNQLTLMDKHEDLNTK